jgi:hypothetical protein
MTTVLTMTLYIVMITFFFLGILLIYNGLVVFYWIWKKRYDYTNTQYEYKKIRYYKKRVIIIPPIMIILGLTILFYKAPISFGKVMESKDYHSKVESIYLMRSSSEISENKRITDKNEINNILNTLAGYRYIRNLQESRFGYVIKSLGDVEFVTLSFTSSGNKYHKTFDITNRGYIKDASTGQAYKVKTGNEIDFFNRLTDALSDKINYK